MTFLSVNVVEDVLPIVWYSLNLPVDRFMVYVPVEVCDAIFVLKSRMMFPFRTSIPFAFACIPANRAQHARSIIPGSLFLFIFCNCSDYIFSFILTLASSPAIITMMRESIFAKTLPGKQINDSTYGIGPADQS